MDIKTEAKKYLLNDVCFRIKKDVEQIQPLERTEFTLKRLRFILDKYRSDIYDGKITIYPEKMAIAIIHFNKDVEVIEIFTKE